MELPELEQLVRSLILILAAGLVAGVICKRLGVALLVGYLVVGAVIGQGGLHWVSAHDANLENVARAGALLLLFSVGIEFSWDELLRLGRFLAIGGTVQMILTTIPTALFLIGFGIGWRPAMLVGSGVALSSTVLVFKALAEWGETTSPHGRRALGILLFQDLALVPLMLLAPLLTGGGPPPTALDYGLLALTSVTFIACVILLHYALARVIVPLLWELRSVELLVLMTACLVGGICYAAFQLGLPPAVGALAAGIMVAGSRLSAQIDSLILPFRETFAAVFFVSLGTLLDPSEFLREPVILTLGLLGVIVMKTMAGGIALYFTGLSWRASFGTALGLSQLGEFSFLLFVLGAGTGAISPELYARLLFIALGTLVLTPLLLPLGLRWTERQPEPKEVKPAKIGSEEKWQRAVVVGMGPIGKQICSRLETQGMSVHAVDYSPINLHLLAQQGFATTSGDAREVETLERAEVRQAQLVVVTVPDDEAAVQVVRNVRQMAPHAAVIVRCRFVASVGAIRKAGAMAVVCEEFEASRALLDLCQKAITPA